MIVAAAAVPVKGGTPVVNVEVADLAEVVAVVEDLAAEPEVGSGVVLDPIVVEEGAIVAVLGPGRYFGEMGPRLKRRRTESARARNGEVRLTGMGLREFRRRSGSG